MSLYLDISDETFCALENLSSQKGWAKLYRCIEPEQIALLFFRLKKVPDDPLIFPRGKWATIQRLEYLIDEVIEAEWKDEMLEDGTVFEEPKE